MTELWANADALGSLREEEDRYGQQSILVARIERLKTCLAEREKCYKKISEDAAHVGSLKRTGKLIE